MSKLHSQSQSLSASTTLSGDSIQVSPNMEEIYGQHMYKPFTKANCDVQRHITRLHDDVQTRWSNYRTDAIGTFMRCYKNQDVESKLWQGQYSSRYIMDDECRQLCDKIEKQNEFNENRLPPESTERIMFIETNPKQAYYACPSTQRDMICHACVQQKHMSSSLMNNNYNIANIREQGPNMYGAAGSLTNCEGYNITPTLTHSCVKEPTHKVLPIN